MKCSHSYRFVTGNIKIHEPWLQYCFISPLLTETDTLLLELKLGFLCLLFSSPSYVLGGPVSEGRVEYYTGSDLVAYWESILNKTQCSFFVMLSPMANNPLQALQAFETNFISLHWTNCCSTIKKKISAWIWVIKQRQEI